MLKRKTKVHRSTHRDAQLKEFEKRDLGKDIAKSGSAVVIKPRLLPTSILLDPTLIAKLQEKARKRGIGYQTMMKIIVAENINRY